MTINEIEVGTRVMLNQDVLAKSCKKRRDAGNFFVCSGTFGATLYQTNLGTVIRNCHNYDECGDMCYSYDLFVPARGVLIHFDERFVVDVIGSATVTLRSLDSENVSLWLSSSEFEQLAFIELD